MNKKQKRIIIASIITISLLIGGIVLYKEKRYSNNNQESKYDFSETIKQENILSFTVNGKKTDINFPTKDSGYKVESVTCENGATAEWDSTNWGLTKINPNDNSKISCSINFISNSLCQRATTLHSKTCSSQSTYACKTTVGLGNVIRYGNLGTSGQLTSGDAFDCDVNGDGVYDSETERFYYVTDLESDKNIAVLIYYSNTRNASLNSSTVNIDNTSTTTYGGDTPNGPTFAIGQLPYVEAWPNVQLTNIKRTIKNELGENIIEFYYRTSGAPEQYFLRAARLLTYQEVISACGVGTPTSTGYLDKCEYLLENSYYDINDGTGYWLETYSSKNDNYVNFIYTGTRSISNNYATTKNGVRPVIEVPKSDISY